MTNERAPLPYANRVQAVTPLSPFRVPSPLPGGYCPRPGCGQRLYPDVDGQACLCGYRWILVAHPMKLEHVAEPYQEIGRWR